jgi:8-oxo-dGTP diphosphatase
MLKYNLCLIRQGTRILLLNREFPPWMGCWNGIGGKLEKDELPRLSMLREILEETQLDSFEIYFKGLITWTSVEGAGFGGMYIYLADIPEEYVYPTPVKTDEGILDWKEINWILDSENLGVASNIPSCLGKVLQDNHCYDHHSIFAGNKMINQISTMIDSRIEEDEDLRNEYLNKYIEEGLRIR